MSGTYSFLVNAGNLPNGLTLSSNGALSGTPSAAGTFNFTIQVTDSTKSTGTQAFTLIINQGNPVLSVTNSPLGYDGNPHSAVVTGSVSGIVSNVQYNGSPTVPTAAGTYAVTASFTPSDSADFTSFTGISAGNFIISRALPTLTWTTPAPITYGTALSSLQLDAASMLFGTFVYTPSPGTVLALGFRTYPSPLLPAIQPTIQSQLKRSAHRQPGKSDNRISAATQPRDLRNTSDRAFSNRKLRTSCDVCCPKRTRDGER